MLAAAARRHRSERGHRRRAGRFQGAWRQPGSQGNARRNSTQAQEGRRSTIASGSFPHISNKRETSLLHHGFTFHERCWSQTEVARIARRRWYYVPIINATRECRVKGESHL